MTIASPKIANDYPDRPLECQFAIESAFLAVAREAQAAGWTESEVAAALIDLAHNFMAGMIEDEKTKDAIDAARTDSDH